MANNWIDYKRIGDSRYLGGQLATVEDCNSAYLAGNLREHHYNKRLRKNETISGRSIMREDDWTEIEIDAYTGMEGM